MSEVAVNNFSRILFLANILVHDTICAGEFMKKTLMYKQKILTLVSVMALTSSCYAMDDKASSACTGPQIINQIIQVCPTTAGLDSHASLEQYLARLQQILSFFCFQFVVMRRAYLAVAEDLDKTFNTDFGEALAQTIKTRFDELCNTDAKDCVKTLALCEYLIKKLTLYPTPPLGCFAHLDYLTQLLKRCQTTIHLVLTETDMKSATFVDCLHQTKSKLIDQMEDFFDHILVYETQYQEILRVLRREIFYSKQPYETYLMNYYDISLPLPDDFFSEAGRSNFGYRIQQKFQGNTQSPKPREELAVAKPHVKIAKKSLPLARIVKEVYQTNSARVRWQGHFIKIDDHENAMTIFINKNTCPEQQIKYPSPLNPDLYDQHIQLWFKQPIKHIKKIKRLCLAKKIEKVRQHRFSPLVDQYVLQLGTQYLDIHENNRVSIICPANPTCYQQWIWFSRIRNCPVLTRLELDAQVMLGPKAQKRDCTFSYKISLDPFRLVKRIMNIHKIELPC